MNSSWSSGRQSASCLANIWDYNTTWNTTIPDFTECFQQIVFVLVPYALLCATAIFSIWRRSRQLKNVVIPWTSIRILKMILCAVLIVISILEIYYTTQDIQLEINQQYIYLYASSAKILAFVFVIVILKQNKDCGVASSTILSVFWFIFSICGVFIYRSSLLKISFQTYPIPTHKFALDSIQFPIVCCMFILSLFIDGLTEEQLEAKDPFEATPFFSFITFNWLNECLYKGAKTLLTIQDLRPLATMLKARYLWDRFYIQMKKAVAKMTTGEITDDTSLPSLCCVLLKTCWQWLALTTVLQTICCFIIFAPPVILDFLIKYVSTDEYKWRGYFYCIALFSLNMFYHVIYNVLLFYSMCFAQQLKSCLITAIYRKSIRLSNSTRSKYTSGEMVNLIAVDVNNVYNLFMWITLWFGSPLKIVLNIVFLWQYLGPSCLSGIAVLAVMILANATVVRKANAIQKSQMEAKDSRLKNMAEILNGIKVLKLYAWEIPFMKRISEIRNTEVGYIKIFQLLYAVPGFIWSSTPFVVAVASFTTYTLIDKNNILDPSIVFVSINLLNSLRLSVMEIPELFARTIINRVSLQRMCKFLVSEEHDDNTVGPNTEPGESISMRDGSFFWEKDRENVLHDIDLHIKSGSLVAIVGPVGAGKSSLLSAMLGDMYKASGAIDVKGTIAYAPQQPWILNQTLKQNVLFLSQMDQRRYNSVIKACCLKPDIEILPAGDSTEIGEKGVTLSGGQKHRVSLARAVYNGADIYLLDDPLSAVDTHVGKYIFEHVIGNNGILKNKTRILVTHNISVLPDVDFIVTMKDGRIEETGTYKELMKNSGSFADFMEKHKQSVDDDEASEEEDDGRNVPSLKSVPSMRQRSISRSSTYTRTTSIESGCIDDAMGRITEDEKMEIGKVKRSIYLQYAKYMSYGLLGIIVLTNLIRHALEISSNIWLSKWSSDSPLPDGSQDVALRNMRLGVYAALGIAQGLVTFAGAPVIASAAARASRLYHSEMLQSVMKSPMSFFDTTPVGRIINRFGRDMDEIDIVIPMILPFWITAVLLSMDTFIVIGISTPIFIAYIIPIVIVYYLVQRFYIITSRQLKRLSAVTNSPILSHFTESIAGASSIRAYSSENIFIKQAEEKIDDNARCNFYWIAASRWLEFRLGVLGELVVLVAAILAVESKNTLEAAVVALSLTYALSVTKSLVWVINQSTELENRSVSIERVEEYVHLPPEAPWCISSTAPPSSWPTSGDVELKDYSTRYREGLDLVLKNINLKINANEKVGIVGRTGAGKSSFALALFRIIEPTDGTIYIDEIDVSNIGLYQLRSKLTIIPQDPVLFTGSLRMNLDPNCDYTDAELWTSLENAHLKDFVVSLKEGLEYDVSEGGSNLSVGQRQLVCLARALLKKAKVLILDEATAAVDMDTDQLIQNTIRTEFKNYTIITIAHRLNTIMDYDRVIVMDSGKIVEVGTPSELLQKQDSLFHNLAKDAGLV